MVKKLTVPSRKERVLVVPAGLNGVQWSSFVFPCTY